MFDSPSTQWGHLKGFVLECVRMCRWRCSSVLKRFGQDWHLWRIGSLTGDFRGDFRGDLRGDFKSDLRGDFKGDLRGDPTGPWCVTTAGLWWGLPPFLFFFFLRDLWNKLWKKFEKKILYFSCLFSTCDTMVSLRDIYLSGFESNKTVCLCAFRS